MTPEERRTLGGGSGRLSEDPSRNDAARYWQSKTLEEHFAGIIEIRKFYHEVIKPGSGAKTLDRSVGGTRSLRD